ncbi:MAG: polysaccharide deacetylase family protein [Flavobacteriales bacterium]|nr:polysaccharide deacetylase family protein [Flavobacteriales bacterium]MCX7768246.1 polysaccharide deacetylase family protein [Flavobacteriales bacterium]MDW8410593.1 polysaccharide deacetylase family protein [Flavobacteriales bacterium]
MLRHIFFQLSYALRIYRLLPSSPWVTVLCLHRVGVHSHPLFPPLSPNTFRKFIHLLKREFDFTTFTYLGVGDKPIACKRPFVILSFDDGYKDFMEYALPILVEEKIPSNHNIIVDCVETGKPPWTQRFNNILLKIFSLKKDFVIEKAAFHFRVNIKQSIHKVKKDLFKQLFNYDYPFLNELASELENRLDMEQAQDQMMNWNDINECQRWGVEIGSHSYYHSPLCNPSDFWEKEISQSKIHIESRIGKVVHTFAFPNGLVHPEAYQAAVQAGYRNILLIEGGSMLSVEHLSNQVGNYFRRLIRHASPYENYFNVVGFHRLFHR